MEIKIKSIRSIKRLAGKKVFLRADFNVPLRQTEKGVKIKDDYKITAGLKTIRFLRRYKSKIIIATHLGNPKGRDNFYSTKPLAYHLGKLLGQNVEFVNDCYGLGVGTAVSKMKPGDILFLENLRFYKEEKNNDKKFAYELAKLANIYVNNAFAVSHRRHASVNAIKKYLPAFAGLLVEEEVMNLERVLHPEFPLVLVMGGAKISTKIHLLEKLYPKSFRVLIGGALANNFLVAHNFEVGQSLIDEESLEFARRFKHRQKIILPVDVMVRNKINKSIQAKKIREVKKDDVILDIGVETVNLYTAFIRQAKTIIWNGPMGMLESQRFRYGTLAIAECISRVAQLQAFGVAGGGETVEALRMAKLVPYLDWVSTGGGAMLAFLGGEKMPGLEGIAKYN